MENIIKELYYGNVCPNERCGTSNLEIKKQYSKIKEKREELCDGLTDKQKHVLEVYDELLSELSSLYIEEYFEDGFRLGAKFIIEVFNK